MESTSKCSDPRLKRAAEFYSAVPSMKLHEAMRAVGFSENEITSPSVQMKVRRRPEYQQKKNKAPIDVIDTSFSSTISGLSSSSSSSTKSKKASKSAYRAKTTRLLPHQVCTQRNNKRMIKKKWKAAHKTATAMYEQERKKLKTDTTKLSADAVAKLVNDEYGSNLSGVTIRRYCNNNMAGLSPLENGRTGYIPPDAFAELVGAFESYVRIHQANGNGLAITRKNLISKVNKVVAHLYNRDTEVDAKLLDRLLRNTDIDFSASAQENIEDRRHRWTTFANLKLWFDVWEMNLIKLGFAKKNKDGEIEISASQLQRIINLDETCLSLDGNQGRRGGRPSVSFFDPNIPQTGKTVSKSSVTYTLICGSSAAGEALPPHFQFSTTAKTEDRQKLKLDVVAFMQKTRGTWGFESEQLMPVTMGMNEKGGMDDAELAKYLFNSIVPLYPDAEDKPGKRVLIKVDCGPGRKNIEMLAELRARGFYLYPGVPNTTSVTQETDQNYGPFKTTFRKNLDNLVSQRKLEKKSTTIQSHLIGLLVFGGVDPETNIECCSNAFEDAFNKKKCLDAWKKVGAAPLTRACLDSKKVRHELGEDESEDPLALVYRNMQIRNDCCVKWLNMHGFKGDFLQASIDIKQHSVKAKLTVPNSKERIQLLKNAKSHGDIFQIAGGDHVTGDDFFASAKLKTNEKEVAKLKTEKKVKLEKQNREEKGLKILEANLPMDQLKKPDLETLLLWYGIPKKDHPKGNEAKCTLWTQLKAKRSPPLIEKWTDEDEKKLVDLQNDNIDMKDTALGRAESNLKVAATTVLGKLTKEERVDFINDLVVKGEELDKIPMKDENANDDDHNSDGKPDFVAI